MPPPSHLVDKRHDGPDSRHGGSLRAEDDISFAQPDRLVRGNLFVRPSTKSHQRASFGVCQCFLRQLLLRSDFTELSF